MAWPRLFSPTGMFPRNRPYGFRPPAVEAMPLWSAGAVIPILAS